jgi:hypothetical protein
VPGPRRPRLPRGRLLPAGRPVRQVAHRRQHPQRPLRARRQGGRLGPRPLRRHLTGW